MILIGALIFVPFALVFVLIAGMIFMTMFMPGHKSSRTAKTKPEITDITPMTWTEQGISTGIPGKPGSVSRTASRQYNGFRVTYKFNSSDGQSITHTEEKRISNDPSGMAQVCYDPKDPNYCVLDHAGECY